LQEVNVLTITGYDGDGNVAYDYDHLKLSKERLAWLDDVAWQIVESDICDGGHIFEEMWERA